MPLNVIGKDSENFYIACFFINKPLQPTLAYISDAYVFVNLKFADSSPTVKRDKTKWSLFGETSIIPAK